MHHPEKSVLGTTAGTGNTATRILMKDGLYVMGTGVMKFTCNLMHIDLIFYTTFIPRIWFQVSAFRVPGKVDAIADPEH